MVDHLLNFPLAYQPGTRWHYSVSTDVCARLVEIISEQPIDRFLQQRIFDLWLCEILAIMCLLRRCRA